MSRRIGLTLLLIACLIVPLISPQASLAQRSVDEKVVDLQPHGLIHMDHPDRVPNEYIVVFEDTVGVNQIQSVERSIQQAGGKINQRYEYALKGLAATLSETHVKELVNNPSIRYISANIRYAPESYGMPAPKTKQVPSSIDNTTPQPDNYTTVPANSWGRDRITQRWLPLDGSYHYSHTGAGVRVYIIDSGLLKTHTEFQPASTRIGPGWNFLENSSNVYDCDGHGTKTAGIIGGNTVGVAPGVIIHPLQVVGQLSGTQCNMTTGTVAHVIQAINWVIGQRVAMPTTPMVLELSNGGAVGLYTPLYDAVNNAVNPTNGRKPIPAVSPAHNQNLDACQSGSWKQTELSVPNVIGVGGVEPNDARFRYPEYANGQNGAGSNYGSCIDVFAPSTWVRTASHTGNTCYTGDNSCLINGQQQFFGGTSAAGPHVAGVVALFQQANPSLVNNPPALQQAIINSSTKGVLRNNNNDAQETVYINGANNGAASLGLGSPNRLLYAFNHHHTWGRLVRGNNTAIGKHWASTLPLPAGFTPEYSWAILEHSQANTRPLYACTHPSLGQNVISTNANCEGLPGKTNIGHVFTSQVAGTIPIYRCSIGNGADHFISPAANCEGQVVNYLLGYGNP